MLLLENNPQRDGVELLLQHVATAAVVLVLLSNNNNNNNKINKGNADLT